MSTDRVLLGKNDAEDYGLWISKPTVNVRAVSIGGAFDENGSKDFAEMAAITGWNATTGRATIQWDNPNAPIHTGGGNLIFKQTGDDAFLYTPQWPLTRTGDTPHTFEADGNTYPILEMNVRNISYGQPATSEMSASVVRHSYMNSKLGHFTPSPGVHTYHRFQGISNNEIEFTFGGNDLNTPPLPAWPYSNKAANWWSAGDVVDLILTVPEGYNKSGEKIIYRSRITRTAGHFIYLAANWALPPSVSNIGFMNYLDTFIYNTSVPGVTPSITYEGLINSETIIVNRSKSFQSEPHNYDSRLDSAISVPNFNENSTYTLNDYLSTNEKESDGTLGKWKTLEWDFRISNLPKAYNNNTFKIRSAFWQWTVGDGDWVYYYVDGNAGQTELTDISVGDTFELHYNNSGTVDTVTVFDVYEYPNTNDNRIIFRRNSLHVASGEEVLVGYTPSITTSPADSDPIGVFDRLVKIGTSGTINTESGPYIGSEKEISNWTQPEYATYTPNGVNWNSMDDTALNGSDLIVDVFPYLESRERNPDTNGYGGTIHSAKIAGLRFQFNGTGGGYSGGTHYEIASIRAKKEDVGPGAPAYPGSWKNLQFATGQVGDIDPMYSGLIHQTGIVTVGTDATDVGAEGGRDDWGSEGSSPVGVVHLADPLPYIPFILFQRYDGQSTDPVVAYPSNILDISYCGTLGNSLNMGIIEYKSGHTDPTLPSGHGGMSYSWAMRRIDKTGRDGIHENEYKFDPISMESLHHSQDFQPTGLNQGFPDIGNGVRNFNEYERYFHFAAPFVSGNPGVQGRDYISNEQEVTSTTGYEIWHHNIQYECDLAGRNIDLHNWNPLYGDLPSVSGIWTRLNSPVVGRNNFKDVYEYPCAVSFPSGAIENPTCWSYDTNYDGVNPSGDPDWYVQGKRQGTDYYFDVFRSRWWGPADSGSLGPRKYFWSSCFFSPIDPRPGTVHEGLTQSNHFGHRPAGTAVRSGEGGLRYGHNTGLEALTENYSYMSPVFWGQSRSWKPNYPTAGFSGAEVQFENDQGDTLPDYDNPFISGDRREAESATPIADGTWPGPGGFAGTEYLGVHADNTIQGTTRGSTDSVEVLGQWSSVRNPLTAPDLEYSRIETPSRGYDGIEYGPTYGYGKWKDSHYLGGRMVSPMGHVAGGIPRNGPRFFSLWGDLHYVTKTEKLGGENWGFGAAHESGPYFPAGTHPALMDTGQTTQTGYPNLAQINTSPGAVYKWMIIETLKMRTFAYVRAGKDRFEITARGALGREGYEEQSHGTWERPTLRQHAGTSDNSAPPSALPKPGTLEIMWDQKDHTANGVLPPSIYTAEHISDWGWIGENLFVNLGGTDVNIGRKTEGDQRHELLPGFSYGGTSGWYPMGRPPWDWGGAQTFPVEPVTSEQIHVARQSDSWVSSGTGNSQFLSTSAQWYFEHSAEIPVGSRTSDVRVFFENLGTMQNIDVPAIGALKSGWKPYSSRMTRYGKVSFGRDDMLYARNSRLHQNNADICPGGTPLGLAPYDSTGGDYNNPDNQITREGGLNAILPGDTTPTQGLFGPELPYYLSPSAARDPDKEPEFSYGGRRYYLDSPARHIPTAYNDGASSSFYWGWADPRHINVNDDRRSNPIGSTITETYPWGPNYVFFNEAEYRTATPELGVGTGYGCHVQFWPPGGMVNMAYEPSLVKAASPAGGYASMIQFVPGNEPDPDDPTKSLPGRATEGIFHPRGVSQYEENVMTSSDDTLWEQNQTYDLVNNNESTRRCSYRYYVLRIPANLDAMRGIDV